MKFKMFLTSLLVLATCGTTSTTVLASEINNNSNKEIVQQQLDAFDSIDEQIRTNSSEIQSDKGAKARNTNSYPTRKGVILVTKDGSLGSLVGHAGIIYNSSSTVESFPDGGVTTYSNNWNTRYQKVYGVSVSGTSATADASAANKAYSYKGKPYNWSFFDINTTSKFYCSQLVYKSYLDTTGKNLNQGGGIVFPIDLVQSNNTYTIYTKGV